ncbi:putative septum site-determining protein minD, chloroplastic [Glycine max]|nr:putative septum site-determining protein minD, chloroplastic [Glycine max]
MSTTTPRALQWNRKPELFGSIPCVAGITSSKGGVSKTTTTANIGLSLACLGFSVVAIDVDVSLRNLDLLLDIENRVNYTVIEVLNGDCRLDQVLVRDKRWSNFELLCISKPHSKLPLEFGGKALTWLVDVLKARSQRWSTSSSSTAPLALTPASSPPSRQPTRPSSSPPPTSPASTTPTATPASSNVM